MRVEDACQIMNGTVIGGVRARERFRGAAVDTRSLQRQNAFFCLSGARTDGHRFAPDAARLGAGMIVAEKKRAASFERLDIPIVGVDDPLTALGELAIAYRQLFPTRYIAVTGSVGKTTTKELIAGALAPRFEVFKSPGNYNTLIGIPLALLARAVRAGARESVGVLEFGMSTPGEIARLTQIVDPHWGVVTRIGAAHLMQMKSLAAVAKAKRELFDYARPDAVAFLNNDDPYQRRWAARWRRTTVTYGLEEAADFYADQVAVSPDGVTFRANGRHRFTLSLAGAYNVPNALAAVAVARTFRVPWAEIREGLARVRAVGERSRIVQIAGVTLIEDCYNANPTSMTAALKSLRLAPAARRRIAVLGAMHELGDRSDEWHARLARATQGLDALLTVGRLAKAYLSGIPRAVEAHHYDRLADAAHWLARHLQQGDIVLMKASRAEGLERITPILKESLSARKRRG